MAKTFSNLMDTLNTQIQRNNNQIEFSNIQTGQRQNSNVVNHKKKIAEKSVMKKKTVKDIHRKKKKNHHKLSIINAIYKTMG